jgi:outer membrane murein-binding lipoprotein Lpp
MKKLLSIFAIVASLFIIGCASAATPSDAAVNIYELIANGVAALELPRFTVRALQRRPLS